MKQALVSIVTRTKNRPLMLKRAIKSVIEQTFEDWVMIIVNDGGTVKPVEDLVENLDKKFKDKIVVTHNEKSVGMEAASNVGIKATRSRYILIHDDDDSLHPRFLEKTVSFLESENGQQFGAVATKVIRVIEEVMDDNINILAKQSWNKEIKTINFAEMLVYNRVPPISLLYRREIHDFVGYYNETLPVLGDWEFYLRLMTKKDIFLIQEELAYYHHRASLQGGVYSNTIISGLDNHKLYDTLIRNDYLRKDLSEGRYGLGYLLNIAKIEHNSNLTRTQEASKEGHQSLLRLIKFNRVTSVVIYGTGEFAKGLYHVLSIHGIKVIRFVDSNSSCWGNVLFNIPIVSISEAIQELNFDAIVIGSFSFIEEIALKVNEEFDLSGKRVRIFSC